MRKNDSLLYLRHQFRMVEERIHKAQRRLHAVSYTHLTLPTILRV